MVWQRVGTIMRLNALTTMHPNEIGCGKGMQAGRIECRLTRRRRFGVWYRAIIVLVSLSLPRYPVLPMILVDMAIDNPLTLTIYRGKCSEVKLGTGMKSRPKKPCRVVKDD